MIFSPMQVSSRIVSIVSSKIFFSAITVTTIRVMTSIALVILVGGLLVALSSKSQIIEILASDIVFVLAYTMPSILWVFLALLLMGLSPLTPVIIVAIVASPHFFLNLREGLKELDRDLIEVGQVYGDDSISTARHIALPQLYPYIMAAFRSMMSTGWKAVIVAEVFTATSGIGYHIYESFNRYDGVGIAAWGLIILFIILSIDRILKFVDGRFMRRYQNVEGNEKGSVNLVN
ncbi:MAG: ABC transporter permease [Candidatus Nanohaloarchaea archaeon]